MSPPPLSDQASSPVIAIVLLIGIVFILAMLVLLMCLGFQMPQGDPSVPVVFRIALITYVPDVGGTHVRGIVTITNTRPEDYRNRYLEVITYVNDRKADCNIPTLNNNLFITLNHDGVWKIWGVGTWGNRNFPTSVWPGHSDISIEYKKEIMHPGDRVTLEFIDTTTNQMISRDTYPHTTGHDARWFYNYFLNPQAA